MATTIDITDIIDSGADTTKVYHKVVADDPGSTAVAFAATDIVAYLQAIDGIGASKEVAEYRLYHKADSVKTNKGSNNNDINFTEALTSDALTAMKNAYDNDSYIVTGIFDEEGTFIYGAFGQITNWGLTLPDNDVAQLTYTMSVSKLVTCTAP